MTSGFLQGLKTSCIQTPLQALLLGRVHDLHYAGALGAFPTPRESWLCPCSGPQRDQLPVLHASSRLKHLLEAPGARLLAGYCGMKYHLASWSVTMKDENPVPAESQSFLPLAWPPAHRPPQSLRRLSSEPMLHTALSSLQPPYQHAPTSCCVLQSYAKAVASFLDTQGTVFRVYFQAMEMTWHVTVDLHQWQPRPLAHLLYILAPHDGAGLENSAIFSGWLADTTKNH